MSLENSKLTYFDLTGGRAESIRLALTIGEIKFEDNRIQFPQWPETKPSTPWGSLPVLELSDGSVVAQQRAILRFVGKQTGLYPVDPLQAARVDELFDVFEDCQTKVNAAGQGMEQAAKEAARKEVMESGAVSQMLEKLDAYIGKHGKGGFCVGDKLSCADLMLYATLTTMVSGLFDGVPENSFDRFKNIQAVRKTVATNPKVSAYHDSLKDKIKPIWFVARSL